MSAAQVDAHESGRAPARTTSRRRWSGRRSERRWSERRWPTRVFAWSLAITTVLSPAVHFPPAWVLGCIGGFFLAAGPPLRAELYSHHP